MTEITTGYLTTFKQSHYPSRQELHSTFGGIIIESDYSTEYNARTSKVSFIASRIATARKFDYQCLRNAETRERGKTND